MRILYVSAVLPFPLFSGGQVRIYNLLKRASKHHQITLLSFIRDYQENDYLRNLDFLRVRTVYRGHRLRPKYLFKFLLGKSLLLSSYENESMNWVIADELKSQSYDLIHLEPFYVIPSVPKVDIPVIVCEHNIEFSVYKAFAQISTNLFMKPYLELEAERIKRAEISAMKMAQKIIAVSDSDAQELGRFTQSPKITIVPNGVDVKYYSYMKRNKNASTCLFVGDFKWMPNRELLSRMLTDIWPVILTTNPRATLRIVGQSVPGSIKLTQYENVEFVQNISDIRAVYNSSALLLSPVSIPGGTKYKILEAMATGLPVLTTPAGLSGLRAKGDVHAFIAQTPEEFAQITKDILSFSSHVEKITQNARKLIENNYSWDKITLQLEKVWLETYEK